MVILTSNKRPRFKRQVTSAQNAVLLAYSQEQIQGEKWTVDSGTIKLELDPMRDPLVRAQRAVHALMDAPQGATVANMRELQPEAVYEDLAPHHFVSVYRLGAWVVLGVSAVGMVVYALAYL